VTRPFVAAVAIAWTAWSAAAAAQHPRLFPPQSLGQLEGPDRDAWQRPDQIMDALQIGEGSVVADLGAGGGWFTVRLARQVGPNGQVYAEDIQPQMIQAIKSRVTRELLRNVTTQLGTPDDPKLPAGRMDVVLIVDAYHEIEHPVALLKNVVTSLKSGGVVAIVNFKKDGGGPGPSMEERVDPEQVVSDARAAGLALRKRDDFLRYQYMLTFGVPAPPASK
jgi:ubiquinone/menaquinone biosynthesis C-methylase UbiE